MNCALILGVAVLLAGCGSAVSSVEVEQRSNIPEGATASTVPTPAVAGDQPPVVEVPEVEPPEVAQPESEPVELEPIEESPIDDESVMQLRDADERDQIFVASRPSNDEFGDEWESGPSEGSAVSDPSWMADPACDLSWMSTSRDGKETMQSGWVTEQHVVSHTIMYTETDSVTAQVLADLATIDQRCEVITYGSDVTVEIEATEVDEDGLWIDVVDDSGQRALLRVFGAADFVSVMRLRFIVADDPGDSELAAWFVELVGRSEQRLLDAITGGAVPETVDDETDPRLLSEAVVGPEWKVPTGDPSEWPAGFDRTSGEPCQSSLSLRDLQQSATSSIELVGEGRRAFHWVVDTASSADASLLVDAFVDGLLCIDPEAVEFVDVVSLIEGRSAHVVVGADIGRRGPTLTEYAVFASEETVGFITVVGRPSDDLDLAARDLAAAAVELSVG